MALHVHARPNKSRSGLEGLLTGLDKSGVNERVNEYLDQQQASQLQNKLLGEEDIAAKRLGIDVTGLKNPKLREEVFKSHFKENEVSKEAELDDQRKNVIARIWGPEVGELYTALTEGGKTKMVTALLEGGQREMNLEQILGRYFQENPEEAQSILQKGFQQPQEGAQETLGSSIAEEPMEGEEEIPEWATQNFQEPGQANPQEFQWPKVEIPKGRTAKEKVSTERDREKLNTPIYEAMNKTLNAARYELNLIKRLNQLNETHKLPKFNPFTGDTSRLWNINEDGNLNYSGLANAETQLYVKTVNEFTRNAQATYGSRVTNFDLQQFMTRLPRLSNTEEGRRLILAQMKLVNEKIQMEDESLQKAFDHYGLHGASIQQLRQSAAKFRESGEKEWEKRWETLDGQLDSVDALEKNELPSPVKNKGKTFRDNDTGELFKSDGKTWNKVKK